MKSFQGACRDALVEVNPEGQGATRSGSRRGFWVREEGDKLKVRFFVNEPNGRL
jgi:hypothetical protein